MYWSKTLIKTALLLVCASGAGVGLAQSAHDEHAAMRPQTDLPRLELRAKLWRAQVQLAADEPSRQIGLMYRRQMPANEGMLFAFPRAGVQCFWMKNTPLPLTAAFLADDGTVVNLADMQPHDERTHCSAQPVRFVLEMHQGWFAQKGIGPGDRIQGLPALR